MGVRGSLLRRVGLATNGVCVFGALTSVSALFYFYQKEGTQMKKLVALLLSAILIIGLVGCGSISGSDEGETTEKQTASKEELLAEAETVTADELLNEIGGNKAKAASCVGKTYCITGHVVEVEEDYAIVLASDTGDWNNIIHSDDWYAYAEAALFHVYLSNDELCQLEKCENIQFVGTITDTGTCKYYEIEPLYLDVSNAYLVKTNVDYQGRNRLSN